LFSGIFGLYNSLVITTPMIYYTQLIFIKPGREQEFHAFEDKVLPLLKGHNGSLVYRVRPGKNTFIESSRELPYEIHLVTFGSKADFEGYKNDPKRLDFIEMKNNSVEKMTLIEGFEL
jgi:antibiotic biosynthesis monooxygenase (ABM) superfamily enzyme